VLRDDAELQRRYLGVGTAVEAGHSDGSPPQDPSLTVPQTGSRNP